MDGAKFRRIIQSGTDEYGPELWYFLRELAQNSRDAGSDNIRVTAGYLNEDIEFIRFEDDGIGISKKHANEYLFKIYASSKENQKNSIGKYGIGFWTILRFEPYKIIIESKQKKEKWAMQLNTKLDIEIIPTTIKKKGTRITLLRIKKLTNPENYIDIVKNELIKYCKYLTKKKSFDALPILFNNKIINQEMYIPETLSGKIKHKHLSGVIALGKEPKVMLYSKGLPVWNGLVLSDLTDYSQKNNQRFETGRGLAPIFLLNSSNIDINFSRNVPIDNKNLTKMIKIAEKELSKLIFGFIKKTTPWSFVNSINDALKKNLSKIKKSLILQVFIILILLIPMEIYLLNSFILKKGSKTIFKSVLIKKNTENTIIQKRSSLLSVRDNLYSGASVHHSENPSKLDINYTPPQDGLFKLYSASEYDINHGFIYTKPTPILTKEMNMEHQGMSFRIKNIDKGKFFLLNKNSFQIHIPSIKINSKVIDRKQLEYFDDNTVQINLTNKKNSIEYHIYPLKNAHTLSKSIQNKYLKLPNIKIPDYILVKLRIIKNIPMTEKIKAIEKLTRNLIKYENSQNIIEQYKLEQNSDWLHKVLKIKAGDCDVINGVNTLLLRRVNIPARLIIGFIGKKGKIIHQLHAWTEYYDNGWKTIDASIIIRNPVRPHKNKLQTKINKKTNKTVTKTFYNRNSEEFIYIFIIILIILFLLFSIIFIYKTKKMNKLKASNSAMYKSLNDIAINAILYPEIWKPIHIWDYQFIPILGKRYLSLKNILEKSKTTNLYKSTDNNLLLNKNIIKKSFIFDSNDKYYSNLIRIIPNIIDLDRIKNLEIHEIINANIKNPDIKKLLKQTEIILKKTTKNLLRVFVSTKSYDTAFINIKLNKYIFPYSEQFVLINHETPEINNLINQHSNIKHSIFTLIEKILEVYDLQDSEIIILKNRISKSLSRLEI